MSGVQELIEAMRGSRLHAECVHCGEEFKLADSLLFDGRGSFPPPAQEQRERLEEELRGRRKDLVERKSTLAHESEKRTVAVGLGKIVEKVLPAHQDFGMPVPDCRFLAEPIDMMVFHGASQDRINSITFMEIKTGSSKLNAHQQQVRDAVADGAVKWRSL